MTLLFLLNLLICVAKVKNTKKNKKNKKIVKLNNKKITVNNNQNTSNSKLLKIKENIKKFKNNINEKINKIENKYQKYGLISFIILIIIFIIWIVYLIFKRFFKEINKAFNWLKSKISGNSNESENVQDSNNPKNNEIRNEKDVKPETLSGNNPNKLINKNANEQKATATVSGNNTKNNQNANQQKTNGTATVSGNNANKPEATANKTESEDEQKNENIENQSEKKLVEEVISLLNEKAENQSIDLIISKVLEVLKNKISNPEFVIISTLLDTVGKHLNDGNNDKSKLLLEKIMQNIISNKQLSGTTQNKILPFLKTIISTVKSLNLNNQNINLNGTQTYELPSDDHGHYVNPQSHDDMFRSTNIIQANHGYRNVNPQSHDIFESTKENQQKKCTEPGCNKLHNEKGDKCVFCQTLVRFVKPQL